MGIPIISDIFGTILNPVKEIISEVVVDKDKRDQINLQLAQLQDQAQARLDSQLQAQIEVNRVEAASGSVFVAGWRPAIGWVGAASLAYSFILSPFIGIWVRDLPAIQYEYLMTIITAMLGIGGMRTFEKVNGVSTNTTKDVPKRPEPPSPPVVEKEKEEPPKRPHRWQKI